MSCKIESSWCELSLCCIECANLADCPMPCDVMDAYDFADQCPEYIDDGVKNNEEK